MPGPGRCTAAGPPRRASHEIYEWVVDNWFAQHLFIGETDTVTDLADSFLGAGIGGLFLAALAVGRHPRRREPHPI